MKWKILSHTADHAFRVFGKDQKELLHNAFYALLKSIFGDLPHSQKPTGQLQIDIASNNPAVMIIDFLREVHYQIVAEHNIPLSMKILEKDNSELVIELEFIKETERIQHNIEIKAVTYHNIKIHKTGSELFLDVICDV